MQDAAIGRTFLDLWNCLLSFECWLTRCVRFDEHGARASRKVRSSDTSRLFGRRYSFFLLLCRREFAIVGSIEWVLLESIYLIYVSPSRSCHTFNGFASLVIYQTGLSSSACCLALWLPMVLFRPPSCFQVFIYTFLHGIDSNTSPLPSNSLLSARLWLYRQIPGLVSWGRQLYIAVLVSSFYGLAEGRTSLIVLSKLNERCLCTLSAACQSTILAKMCGTKCLFPELLQYSLAPPFPPDAMLDDSSASLSLRTTLHRGRGGR